MKINTLGLLLAIAGEGLLFLIFLYFLPVSLFGGTDVMWLDLAVVSIAYWLWVLLPAMSPISTGTGDDKFVGGLGIRLQTNLLYSLFAIGVAVACIILLACGTMIAFKWQILAQSILLFLLLCSLFSASVAVHKVAEVRVEQQRAMSGKTDVKSTLRGLLNAAEDANGVPAEVKSRISRLCDDTRFISPSTTPAALEAECKIQDNCRALSAAFYDYEMNVELVERLLRHIERDFKERRQY